MENDGLSYYQRSLLAILMSVREAYHSIFLEEEDCLLKSLEALPTDAQRLFFRLYLRKTGWHRVEKLDYKDIESKTAAMEKLIELGLLDTTPSEPEEMLDILQLEELKSLAKSLHVKPSSTREQLKLDILASRKSKQQRLNFGPTRRSIGDENIEKIMEIGRTLAGSVIRIPQKLREDLKRLIGLFFLDSTSEDENLSTAILTDLNKRKYPSYKVARSTGIFATRESWLAWENAKQHEVTVAEILTGEEEMTIELIGDLLEQLKTNWKAHFNSDPSNRSYFLKRYTAGWVYTRMLSSFVAVLEKIKDHEEANRLLELLLGQTTYCLGQRGRWWERLALNLATHLGKKELAEAKCMEALKDVHVRTGCRISLQRRLCKLTKQPFYLDEPLEAIVIYADPETTRTIGRKLLYLSDDGTLVSVEEFVLLHFQRDGWRGFHCESGIYRMLFTLCFWDILYGDTPDVFQTPYQHAPLDLMTDAFYETRRETIEKRLEEIENGQAPQLAVDAYYPFYGCQALGIGEWEEYPLDSLLDICHAIGGAVLSSIFRVLAEDYAHSAAGLPDLLLYRPDKSDYLLVEVKSTNDRLSDAQRNWNAVFRKHGIKCKLCKVLDTHLEDRPIKKNKRIG